MKDKLQHITFTGIDARTNFKALCEIQREFPFVEFGVLTSYHWNENGNRYLDPKIINSLRGHDLNLSLHICGSAARDAALGKWADIDKLVLGNLDIFRRIQINIAERKDCPPFCWIPLHIGQELIIQQRSGDDMSVYEATIKHWCEREKAEDIDPISVLLDASGGRGVDTPIKVLHSRGKVGYAGGMNSENVGGKLSYLLEHKDAGDFWIDMESGVRTDDWFDTEKVIKVLWGCIQTIDRLIRKDIDNPDNFDEFMVNPLTGEEFSSPEEARKVLENSPFIHDCYDSERLKHFMKSDF